MAEARHMSERELRYKRREQYRDDGSRQRTQEDHRQKPSVHDDVHDDVHNSGSRQRTQEQRRKEPSVHDDVHDDVHDEVHTDHETVSNFSDQGTINEYFHEITQIAIHELERSELDRQSQKSELDRNDSKGRHEVDEAILKLEETLRQLNTKETEYRNEPNEPISPIRNCDERGDREKIDKRIERRNIDHYGATPRYRYNRNGSLVRDNAYRYRRHTDMNRHQVDTRLAMQDDSNLVKKGLDRASGKQDYNIVKQIERIAKVALGNENDRQTHMLRPKQEQRGIYDEFERFERESTKLKKLQFEEERKSELLSQHEYRLRSEIETKRKIEDDLLRKIAELEKQEIKLNEQRYRNEEAERKLSDIRHEDEVLAERIYLLHQREKELSERQMRDKGRKGKAVYKTDATDLSVGQYLSSGKRELNETNIKDLSERQKTGIVKQSSFDTNERDLSERHNKEMGKQNVQTPAFKLGMPKIPDFNGKHFEQWRFEVTCLLRADIYPDYALVHAVRNSLKGDTRQILLTLKPTASTTEILKKLEDIYGNVKTADKIIQDFYSAKQKSSETCSEWAVRVEALFQLALEKGEIEESKRDRKLKERFWRGLYSEKLKTATRVSYESHDSFEQLRRKARLEEEEEGKDTSSVKAEVQQQTSKGTDMDEKVLLLKELVDRMKSMEGDIEKMKEKKKLELKEEKCFKEVKDDLEVIDEAILINRPNREVSLKEIMKSKTRKTKIVKQTI